MNYYSEREIYEWFETMIKKYPNSKAKEHLEAVEHMMFNSIFESNLLQNQKKLDKSQKV